MRLVTLFLSATFAASTVGAASYQKTDGTIVDPILNWLDFYVSMSDVPHIYSGANLEPEAYLSHANLSYAELEFADLLAFGIAHQANNAIAQQPTGRVQVAQGRDQIAASRYPQQTTDTGFIALRLRNGGEIDEVLGVHTHFSIAGHKLDGTVEFVDIEQRVIGIRRRRRGEHDIDWDR